MKVPQDFIDTAIAKGVYEKINWSRTKYIKWKIPKPILEALQKNELVLIGCDGEVKSFYNPIAVINPADDYLAQLASVEIKKHYKRIQKQPKEE